MQGLLNPSKLLMTRRRGDKKQQQQLDEWLEGRVSTNKDTISCEMGIRKVISAIVSMLKYEFWNGTGLDWTSVSVSTEVKFRVGIESEAWCARGKRPRSWKLCLFKLELVFHLRNTQVKSYEHGKRTKSSNMLDWIKNDLRRIFLREGVRKD